MLHLYRLTATNAADPVLQRAILGCGLVNLRGKPDNFFEADRLDELLNLQLKETMRSRGNSTHDVYHLFKWGLSLIKYHLPLRGMFELNFGEWTNSELAVKSPQNDIHSLAELLSRESVNKQNFRDVKFYAPELMVDGFKRLCDVTVIQNFDAAVNLTRNSSLDLDDYHDVEDIVCDANIDIQTTENLTAEDFQDFST
ncbi:hypothetical protein BGW36DRAFT_429518 [Talaromyces proteolyticus]|uniref:DUF6589 domain-containing protein n=1 Tax=Talaromyces proteolyticus TaxID=1131652 RepID=A0AAD4KQ27_9EURO|nr:uncharacterized protein BGW36DRAFT_429518 [Talaromyces proteolyticus]KAH8695648.1 hypothetical protein BGW36DRAFT_429518 [Talaromyces proteolyticus]